MGFFSKADHVGVCANTCHLVESNSNTLQEAVLYAIYSGTSIISSILNVSLNQMSHQVDRFWTYANDSYSLGLPEVALGESPNFAEQDVINAIVADTNREHGILLNFHYISPLTPPLVTAPYLFSIRGWAPQTNSITVIPEEFIPDPESLSGFKKIYTEGQVDTIELNDDYTSVTITYVIESYYIETVIEEKEDENGSIFQNTYTVKEYIKHTIASDTFIETQTIPTGLSYGNDYCIASYYVLDSEGAPSDKLYWWYYDISTGVYSALTPETVIDTEADLLPVVPIRYQNQSMTREEVQDTDLYKTSKTLLSKVGLDINTLTTKLEENPDISDIDHAYVTFGVNLQTDEVASIRYLAEFFDYISDKGQASVFTHINDMLTPSATGEQEVDLLPYSTYQYTSGTKADVDVATNEVSWAVSDETSASMSVTSNATLGSFEEYGIEISIDYSYIRSEIISGSIGAIGHATKEWTLGEFNTTSPFGLRFKDSSVLTLKVQVTENSYKQVIVKGLVHKNIVYKGSFMNAVGAEITALSHVIEDEDELNFIIPVHYNLAKKLPPIIRSQMYQDSLVLVINSIEVTSAKWYESTFFKFIIVAGGLVITPFLPGANSFLAGLSTAIAGGLGAFSLFLFQTILKSYAISTLLTYVAQQIGPETMAFLAMATVALAGFAKYANLDGITFLGSTAPAASQLMHLTASMLSSASTAYNKLLGDVANEMEAFEKEKEAKLEKLEEYEKLLGEIDVSAINLLEAQAHSTTLYQPATNSPEEFYDLAIHTGNPGILSLSVPTTYCDIALNLPKPDNSILA